MAATRSWSWDGTANTKLWEQAGCGPSAVLPLGDDLAVTCYDSGTIARVSKDGKTIANYDKAEDGGALQGPNDLTADGKGGVWFTASGPWESGPIVGKVFHLAADGTITEMANDLHYANGIALSGDGKRLMVNEFGSGPGHLVRDRRGRHAVGPAAVRARRRGRRGVRHRRLSGRHQARP